MSEHKHQSIVVLWFKMAYPDYKDCIMSIPNGQILGGKNKFALIKKLKREGFKNGVSDLFIAVPNEGKCGLWIEMKDQGKTYSSVSESQRDHIELMNRMGYDAVWCAGSDEAIDKVSGYMSGLVKKKIVGV
jgi:hypothetical protein